MASSWTITSLIYGNSVRQWDLPTTTSLEEPWQTFQWCPFLNLRHAYILNVEISTRVCRCTLQQISQQLMNIEQCFTVLNILPVSDESLCSIRIYFHWKKLFSNLWCPEHGIKFNFPSLVLDTLGKTRSSTIHFGVSTCDAQQHILNNSGHTVLLWSIQQGQVKVSWIMWGAHICTDDSPNKHLLVRQLGFKTIVRPLPTHSKLVASESS